MNTNLEKIVDAALASLGDRAGIDGAELRERVRQLVEDQAVIASRALAGQDVSEAQRVLAARMKNLEAAGMLITQREIQIAVRDAILTALKIAFELII